MALQICTIIVGASLPIGAAASTQLQQRTAGRVVLVAVVDRANQPLVAVGVDDFVVTENGQPREVLDVHIADYPVVVLIDDSPEAVELLPSLKAAVTRFIARVGERPVAVGTLSHAGAFVASFEDDRADVLKKVEEIRGGGSDAPLPLAPVEAAARLLRDGGVPFSAIVIATAHPIGTTAQVSPDVVASILDSGANIQVVIVRPRDDGAAPAATDLLRVLADQTRGQYTPIFSAASYAIALDRIADRMAAELMIEYVAPVGSLAGEVKVGARLPGARVIGLGVK